MEFAARECDAEIKVPNGARVFYYPIMYDVVTGSVTDELPMSQDCCEIKKPLGNSVMHECKHHCTRIVWDE